MATAEEVKELSDKVSDLSQTIVNVGNTQAKNLALFKEFFGKQREELSASISNAAEKIDKSSRASVMLSAAIALFALVEAGSIFYDVVLSNSGAPITNCVTVAEAVSGDPQSVELSNHEIELAKYIRLKASVSEYAEAFVSCNRLAGNN